MELKAYKQQGSESEVLLSEKSLVVCGLTFMGNLSVADDLLASAARTRHLELALSIKSCFHF